MHRNTFLHSPGLLDRYYCLRSEPRIAFAGQMTGVEGYVESCASGMLAALEAARRFQGKPPLDFPRSTAIGALALYVANGSVSGLFQPMNINYGIIEGSDESVRNKKLRYAAIAERSLAVIDGMAAREDFL